MAIGLLGKKLGMSQVFTEEGHLIPVTVIEAGPCTITQKKTEEKDGYKAVQLGYQELKERNLNRPLKGHFKKHGLSPKKYLREFPINGEDTYQVGDEVTVNIFSEGQRVDVLAKSKGKGFTGVVKRWGFKGGPATHGSRFHRAPGSMGAAADPARVFKGKKLPGRVGGERVTVQNLEVVRVDEKRNLLLVRGSVPGPNKGLVTVKSAVKATR